MAIDVKQLQTIIDNLVTQEMRDFANTPDADKNRLRPVSYTHLRAHETDQ